MRSRTPLDNVMAPEHDAIRALSREEFERQFMANGFPRKEQIAIDQRFPATPSKTDLSARIVAPAVDVPG